MDMQNFGNRAVFFFIAISIVGGLVVGFYIGKTQSTQIPIEGIINIENGKPDGVDFSLFWTTWNNLQEKFVDREDLSYQDMLFGAISGMVNALDDPYTIFMNPDDTKRFLEDVSGSFEGVGMEIGIRERELRVIAPLEGTPAKNAGLRAGDRIVKIDDTFTRSLNIDEAVSLIRGERGTTVTLSIMRDGWDDARDFNIKRAVIEIPSLAWEMKEGNIAYVQLFQFSEKAERDFQKAVSEFLAQGADRIILDLRNNPGGFLEVSQSLAGWFLDRDSVVTIEDFGNGLEEKLYKTRGNSLLVDYPIVVLINEGSASASEILAGALRDNRGVQLIGTQSFGKGSVQELARLSGGSSLKVTVAHWLTPNRLLIQEKGLTPDIEVEFTEEDFENELDPQLDKAIEIVNGL